MTNWSELGHDRDFVLVRSATEAAKLYPAIWQLVNSGMSLSSCTCALHEWLAGIAAAVGCFRPVLLLMIAVSARNIHLRARPGAAHQPPGSGAIRG